MQNEISVDEPDQSLKRSAGHFFIIDLVCREDFAANPIPGAINIPVEEFEQPVSRNSKRQNIVVACRKKLMNLIPRCSNCIRQVLLTHKNYRVLGLDGFHFKDNNSK